MGVQTVADEDVSKYGIMKPSKSHQPEGRMVKLSGMVENQNKRKLHQT